MSDADIDEFARQNRHRQAKVYVAGALVLLVLGVAFGVAGWAALDAKDTVSTKVLGAGIGFIIGAGLLAARAWRLRRP